MAYCPVCGKAVEAGKKFCKKCGAKVDAAAVKGAGSASAGPSALQGARKYAGFWIRFIAAFIDGIFGYMLLGLGWFVNVYLVGAKGWSIGKKVCGLRVEKEDGTCPIGLVDALIREVVGKFVSGILLGIGFFMIGFDEKKQGLHDKIAKTCVVYDEKQA